jgi:3-hydroxyisobutyrate dehydrogenase
MTRTVAVLGTGIMGVAMARNLAGAGMAVRAWNRTREKAEPLAEDGVTVADTPARAAEGADFLNSMLSDADAAALGTTSHFNVSMPLHAAVWYTMAGPGRDFAGPRRQPCPPAARTC